MSDVKKYVITKNAKDDVITYMEYENLKGFNIKPKSNSDMYDMINVNEMIVINPSLIEKLVNKKCKRTLEKIINMLSLIYEDDDSGDIPLHLALDKIEKFKAQIINKYKEYMKEKEYKLLLKKLEILTREVELRIQLSELNNENERGKKSR